MFKRAIVNGQFEVCPNGWRLVQFNFTDYYVAPCYCLIPDGIKTDWIGLSVPKAVYNRDSAGDAIHF